MRAGALVCSVLVHRIFVLLAESTPRELVRVLQS